MTTEQNDLADELERNARYSIGSDRSLFNRAAAALRAAGEPVAFVPLSRAERTKGSPVWNETRPAGAPDAWVGYDLMPLYAAQPSPSANVQEATELERRLLDGVVNRQDRQHIMSVFAAISSGQPSPAASAGGGMNEELLVHPHKRARDRLWEAAVLQQAAGEAAPQLSAASTNRVRDGDAARFRHKKRGATYVVVGECQVQAEEPLTDYEVAVVYRSEQDGELWVRRRSEFRDGRFEEIAPTVAAAEPTRDYAARAMGDAVKADDTFTAIDQEIGWLKIYAVSMTAENWKDMRGAIENQIDGLVKEIATVRRASVQAMAEPTREETIEAIRKYCRSISSAAIQRSQGEDRIYYAGLPVGGLADAILALKPRGEPAREGGQ